LREIYLLRHAETAANEEGVLQGRMDSPLSSRGVRQAQALAEVLVNLGVDAVYASPAGRVAATLTPALQRGLPEPSVMAGLDEIDLGRVANLTYEEFHSQFLPRIDPEEYRRGEYRFPGGESRRDLFERASAQVETILALDWEKALVAAHGGILSHLLAALLGIPFDGWIRFRLDNAALAKLVWYDDRPSLSFFNSCGHLPEELRSPPFPPLFPGRG